MSALQYLNAFISERLTAAAVEIFGAVERTLEDYQEEVGRTKQEIDRLRALVLCPEVGLRSPAHQCSDTEVSPEWSQKKECGADVSLDHTSVLHIKEEDGQGDARPELSGVQQSDGSASPQFVEQERKIPNPHQDQDLPQKLIDSSVAHQPKKEPIEIPHDREQQCTKQNRSACRGHRGLDPPQTQKKRRDADGGQLSRPTRASPPNDFVSRREYSDNTQGGVTRPRMRPRRTQNLSLRGDTSDGIGVKARRHSCLVCKKRFKGSSHLKSHMRIHTGERPFRCKQCGKKFRQSGALTLHTMIHTGERPFQCGDCGRRFSRKGNMESHMATHNAERPHLCVVCGKGFTRKSVLHTHLKIHADYTEPL